MKPSTIAWVVIVILIVVGGAWYFISANGMPSTTNTNTDTTVNTDTNGTDTTASSTNPTSVTVLYGPNGFTPSTVTIKQGDTVTFTNNGAGEMWIASAPHPTHQGYDGTTEQQHCAAGYTGPAPFDQCSVGTTFSFKFDKVGSWAYHNHDDSSKFGKVIVQ